MKKTTLCYIENKGSYLMLYRNRKPDDPNEGKWLGIGGRIEEGETPDECNIREVREETGLRLLSAHFCGIIKFRADMYEDEDTGIQKMLCFHIGLIVRLCAPLEWCKWFRYEE